jgi:hypothetical protein
LHLLMFYYFLFPLPRNTKSARNFVRLCAHVLDIFLRLCWAAALSNYHNKWTITRILFFLLLLTNREMVYSLLFLCVCCRHNVLHTVPIDKGDVATKEKFHWGADCSTWIQTARANCIALLYYLRAGYLIFPRANPVHLRDLIAFSPSFWQYHISHGIK